MRRATRDGQAAVEFIACLILLLLLISGMIHVANMGKASLYLHAALRGRAGGDAMEEGRIGRTPRYISDWRAGPDGVRHTADDTPVHGGTLGLANNLAERSAASPGDWSYVVPDTLLPFSAATLQNADSSLLNMMHAEETIYVEIPAVIRQLVYDRYEAAIREGVWMPSMGGLY